MKKTRSVSVVSFVVTLLVVVFSAPAWAQTVSPLAPGGVKTFTQINPPPCDFSDLFYRENGIDPTQLVARFGDNGGTTRLTGPPATGSQQNYVVDSNCSTNDPTRRNFRILATTGGFVDDGTGAATDFISILAFLVNQTNFETSFSRTVGGVNTISISNSLNPRGIAMQDIVGHFEAYAAVKQRLSDGTFATTPCGTMGTGDPHCFKVNTVNTIFTPNLRQDWRFATNRNAMDGSDGNCINTDTAVCGSISDSPFGYFCDDQLGMWIITYFWFTVDPANPNPSPTQQCGAILASIGAKNGFSLDGTPIVKTADELNNQLEANNCGAEGNEAVNGADGGAIWLICPAIMDPRNGGIAKDAFLDVVRLANGNAQSTALLNNFSCLQNTGKFCNEAAPEN